MINVYVLGKKALVALQLLKKPLLLNIKTIIIATDKEIQNDYSKEIETFAKFHNIHYINRKDYTDEISKEVNLNIAIGWRWLLSTDIPLVVFHDSILPKYRGFNPLVTALLNGDEEIGVTALFGTQDFDKGDIIAQRICTIQYPIKIENAIDLIANEYAFLLELVIEKYMHNCILEAIPQDEAKATFSLWRDEEDYRIDWTKDSTLIKRMINALGFPYKGASSIVDGCIVRIFDAEIFPDVNITNRTPGKVLFKNEEGFVIVCGKGLLKVKDFYSDSGESIQFNKFRIRFK